MLFEGAVGETRQIPPLSPPSLSPNPGFHDLPAKSKFLAVSPSETGFISAAHTRGDIDDTLDVIEQVVAKW